MDYSLLLGLLDANEATKMRLLLLLMAVTTTIYACDLDTQYISSGTCCKMCEPGTRMVTPVTCPDPLCKPCPEGEYQDKYTTDGNCKLQPYCDPNKNLELRNGKSLTQRGQCTCKRNFHCSSEQCITCIPNTRCTPGQQTILTGNHTQDTVCQTCPLGTYSSNGTKCLTWKTCEAGEVVQEKGTNHADTICEKKKVAVGAFVTVWVLVLVIFSIGFLIWKRKGIRAAWGKCRTICVESGIKPKAQELNDNAAGQPDINPGELLLAHPKADNGLWSMAVENEETEPPVQTENGQLLEQEHGKSDIVSQTDSSFDSYYNSCP